MTGTIALHGGGEFLPGDERFLGAILASAGTAASAGAGTAGGATIRVAIVPTAAARGRPDLAAANGVDALERVAAAAGLDVRARAVPIVDAASAREDRLVDAIAEAHLVHFPGGDPDLIPATLRGTPAWAAVLDVLARGGVLAGASAGAMALGTRTWTQAGLIAGLDLVPGIVVVPHAEAVSWTTNLRRFGGDAPPDLAVLGLGERTGVLISDGAPGWRVVGQGEVRWLPSGRRDPDDAIILRDGDVLAPAPPHGADTAASLASDPPAGSA